MKLFAYSFLDQFAVRPLVFTLCSSPVRQRILSLRHLELRQRHGAVRLERFSPDLQTMPCDNWLAG